MTPVAGKKSLVHGGGGGGVVYQRHIMSKLEIYHENIEGYYDSNGGYHGLYRRYHEYIGD